MSEDKKTTIMIKDVPEEKLMSLKALVKAFGDALGIPLSVEPVPTSLNSIITYFESLSVKIEKLSKTINNLMANGFEVGTTKLEQVMKLRDEHLFGAFGRLEKQIKELRNDLKPCKPVIKKKEKLSLKELEKRIKTKLRFPGDITPKLFAVLAREPEREFTSSE